MTCSFARSARSARLLGTALLLLAVPLVGQAASQPASAATAVKDQPAVESQLLALTNAARANAGLPALQNSATLVAVARGWSSHMAATASLTHNPSLASKVAGWSSLGENIAKAYSASQAQSLFMASPDHRANILDAHYNWVGIGAAKASDGSLWFTVDFEQTSGYQASSAPARTAARPKAGARTTAGAARAARAAAASRPNRSLARPAAPGSARRAAASLAARPAERPEPGGDVAAPVTAPAALTAGRHPGSDGGPALLAAMGLLAAAALAGMRARTLRRAAAA